MKLHFNPLETLTLLSSALELYSMVIHQCEEKLEENESKRQTNVDVMGEKHTNQILESAKKWQQNTFQLQNHLEAIISNVIAAGFTKDQFKTLITLNEEYQVELPEIAAESLDPAMAKKLKGLIRAMDRSFLSYNKWEK